MTTTTIGDHELTVIVAVPDRASLDLCLAALDMACSGLRARIVITAAGDIELPPASDRNVEIDVIKCAANLLVPDLWAAGLRAASGDAVAFTTASCLVSPQWARALLAGLKSGADGVGGPFELAGRPRLVDRAMFYLRYSSFLSRQPVEIGDGEIAGDNAAYRLSTLRRFQDVIANGFWEVVFHRSVRSAGGTLIWCPAALVRFQGGMRLGQAMAQRFNHGRHFGAWRVTSGRSPWKALLAAPLVPFVLARRAGRSALPLADHRWQFVGALPLFLVLAGSWAAGEVAGALRGGPGRLRQLEPDGQSRERPVKPSRSRTGPA